MGDLNSGEIRELLERLRDIAAPPADPARPTPPELIQRFAELQEHQRLWLAGKSKWELTEIDAMLRDYRAAMTIGRAGKWLFWLVAGLFGTSFAAAKFGFDLLKWFKGAP